MSGYQPRVIVVDGKVAGAIAHGEQAELSAEPGRHSLYLESTKIMRSPERSFGIGAGQTVAFTCRSRPFGALMVPFSLGTVFKHDVRIILKPAPDAQS